MIELTVISFRGVRVEQSLSTTFDATGGTIGRAPTSALVLDDPDRTVSRTHAQVICRGGDYFIVDRGSNPLQLNGRPIGAGNEAPLTAGDRLLIGSFELLASLPEGDARQTIVGVASMPVGPLVTTDDPFAHLLDGLVPHGAAPVGKPPSESKADSTAGLFPDPLSGGLSTPSRPDPFADLLTPVATTPGSRSADDFSDLVTPQTSAKVESIDSLFNLGAPLANDPLAMSPLADPVMQPNMASAADPLKSLSQTHQPGPHVRGDHLPVAEFGFVPPIAAISVKIPETQPPVRPDLAPPVVNPVVADVGPEEVAISPTAAPVSSDPLAAFNAFELSAPSLGADPLADIGLSSGPARAPIAPPIATSSVQRPLEPAATAPIPPAPQKPAAAMSGAELSTTHDAQLLAALLRGLGPLQQAPTMLTPGLMERIGDMLRSATEGTLQLLHTRQEFKHQVRAQVTMIAAQANNPLKFSPTVEVALAHLLGPGVRGFMPAEAAVRDAYQDLRAHEFGVMVGMRAALEHVIRQFAPEALEQNIATRSRLDAIFSANRKAKLWDQFIKLYAEIAREAEDDFHTLFGKAFLKAYEEQMERLKDSGKA